MTDAANREQVRRDARNAAELYEAGELIAAAQKEADACDRDGYDVTARILRDLASRVAQAERDMEGVHLALGEADIPRADGLDEVLYSEQHRVRLLRERAEQAERERDREHELARKLMFEMDGGEALVAAEARLAKVPALVEDGKSFLEAWIAASVSDDEGILATVGPYELRAMWDAVDEAAEKFGRVLADWEQE